MISFSLNKPSLLLAIFLLALLIRVIAIINLPVEYQKPKSDAVEYDKLAISILTTGTYSNAKGLPTAFREPLYPIFLSLIYYIFGHSYFWVRFIQAILSALLCIIVFFIADRLFNSKVGLLSSLICAIYQPFISFQYYGGPAFLLTENLFTFLFALSVLFLVKLYSKPSTLNASLAGFILGLATLTRSVTVLFFLCIFFWMAFSLRCNMKLKLKLWFIICFSFLLTLLPWAVRNYLVFNKLILTTTRSGVGFFLGNNHLAKGGYGWKILNMPEYNTEKFKEASEPELNNIYFNEGLKYLLKNPKRIPRLFIKKVIIFWYFKGDGRINIFYLALLPFLIFGIFSSFKEYHSPGPLLFLSIFLYFSFIAMLFFGDPRFRYPIEPYIIIFASIGILNFSSKLVYKKL